MKLAAELYINNEKRKEILIPNILQKLAVFLHPKMKSLRKLNETEKNEIHNYADSQLINNEIDNSVLQTYVQRSVSISSRRSSFFDDISSEADKLVTNNTYNVELHKYISHTISESDEFNLEKWWNDNQETFPKLYKLFLRVQSTTSTSAPSERAFSRCGHILTDIRSRTEPSFLNDLMIVSDSVKMCNNFI